MKKKVTVIAGIIIAIILMAVAYVMYNQETHKSQGGTIKDNKTITIESPRSTKHLYLTLGIDNSKCKKPVKYVLKDPEGKNMIEGKVEAEDFLLDNQYDLQGVKGKWTLEFIKDSEEEGCSFHIGIVFSNKKK